LHALWGLRTGKIGVGVRAVDEGEGEAEERTIGDEYGKKASTRRRAQLWAV